MRHEWDGSLADSRDFFEVTDWIDRKDEAGTGEEVGVVRAVEVDLREPNESQEEAKEEEVVDANVSVGEDRDVDDIKEDEMVAMQALQELRLVRRRTRATSDRP